MNIILCTTIISEIFLVQDVKIAGYRLLDTSCWIQVVNFAGYVCWKRGRGEKEAVEREGEGEGEGERGGREREREREGEREGERGGEGGGEGGRESV